MQIAQISEGMGLSRPHIFDCKGGDFTVFSERLEQHFIVNQIKEGDPRRNAMLLTSISDETYKLLRDLCFPEKPANKKYDELTSLLENQLGKKRSIFAERFKFHRARQEESETVQEWSAKLKRLAAYCNFADGLDIALRDRFIVGLKEVNMINRLFREPETLKFAQAVDIVEKMETANVNASAVSKEDRNFGTKVYRYEEYKKTSAKPKEQHKGAHKTPGNLEVGKEPKNSKCFVCGKNGHLARNCKYKSYKCRNCGTLGHLMAMCKNKGVNKGGKDKCYWNAREAEEEEVTMYSVTGGKSKPFKAKVRIGKVEIDMEIDSGSGVSTISLELYNRLFRDYKLEGSNVVLISYTQGKDRPVGRFKPKIEYGGKVAYNDLHVVANGGPPLLGRDLMKHFNIQLVNLNSLNEQDKLQSILDQFQENFRPGLGTYKYDQVKLTLQPGVEPVFVKPRPLPFIFKEMVEKELDRLQEEGMITPVESSVWGTPLVPILKKDGSLRLCADYKVTLNRFLEQVKYPLPRIEELFARLQGGQEFSKLDLSQAYNQLMLEEESQMLATWSTHKGLFKVNRLPYGVSPAAAKFQMMLERLLQGMEGVVNFLDDIVVTGGTREKHESRLIEVLGRLKKAGLRLNKDKCQFFQKQIKYLGHIIDSKGLRKDPAKVEAIVKAVSPTNVTQVRSFIGMIGYYGKFIPNLASVMKPLYSLLAKGSQFVWSEECEKAFTTIKQLMCSEQVLAHYNPDLPVRLACDASMDGIGAVLTHVDKDGSEKPIAFTARTLTSAERNYSMIEKEALSIYYSVRHFHQYLLGRMFTLVTDHKPLLAIFGEHRGIPIMAAGRLQRWALFLAGYNYQITGIKGKDNYGPDYLSRSTSVKSKQQEEEEPDYLHFVESRNELPIDSKVIARETRTDVVLSRILEYSNSGWPKEVKEELVPYFRRKEQITVEQQCVMWGYRVVIPVSLRQRLLHELHSTHLGVVKMKGTARSLMWWPNLDKDIEELSKNCEACALNRQEPNKSCLVPWARPKAAWQRIHIDYLGPVRGKMFLLVVDALSKWPEVIEVAAATAEHTIGVLRELFAHFGLPIQVVSDNGTQFTAKKFQDFMKFNGIRHTFTVPAHPAMNGQAENAVKTFKVGIYKALADKNNAEVEIQTLVARFLLSYRNAPHGTTGESPAVLMLGRNLRVRLCLIKPDMERKVLDRQCQQVKNFKGKREIRLEEGEVVLVRDYHQVNTKTWKRAIVLKCLGIRTYLCQLEDGRCWRRHINQILNNVSGDNKAQGQEKQVSGAGVDLEELRADLGIKEQPVQEEFEQQIRDLPGVIAEPRNLVQPGMASSRPKRKARPPDRLDL